MRVGIVGPPLCGKTTLFNAVTGLGSTPAAPGRPRQGVVRVPDERIDRLVVVDKPKKTTYATVELVDTARAEHAEGGGFDAGLVRAMRDQDALAVVIRAFESPMLEQAPDPVRDLRSFEAELVLTDLIQVDKRLERIKKEGGKSGEADLLARVHAHLESEKPLRIAGLSEDELNRLAGYAFLSAKPALVVLNLPESEAAAGVPAAVAELARAGGMQSFALSGSVEAEIAELPPDDQLSFARELGLEGPAQGRFVRAAFGLLDLICFLTHGPDECRAWPIVRGTIAQRAAGKVHSDIERGFIRAEVIAWDDFVTLGFSEPAAKQAGKLRVEGKTYVVQDGDLVHFRFAV